MKNLNQIQSYSQFSLFLHFVIMELYYWWIEVHVKTVLLIMIKDYLQVHKTRNMLFQVFCPPFPVVTQLIEFFSIAIFTTYSIAPFFKNPTFLLLTKCSLSVHN